MFKTSSVGEILTASLAGGGFLPWAKLYQLAALISIFSDNSPNYTPISKLVPLEASSEEEIEFWVLFEDQKSLKNSFEIIPETIFSRFEFFLNELSPIAFSRANIAIERTALSVSKRVSWMIKEILPTITTKNMMAILKSLQRIICQLEKLTKILPSWILDVHSQLSSSLSIVDAFLRKSCLSSILKIFNCQESLDCSFPKRPMERSSATPMMRLYLRKLASLRSELRVNSSRTELERYLQIFYDSFKFIFQYFLQTSSSKNRSENLQKDVQAVISIGKQHVALFDAANFKKKSEKLKSKIHRLNVKLLLQFSPASAIDALSPNFGLISRLSESSQLPVSSKAINEQLAHSETLPLKMIRSFCLEKFEKWNYEEFLKIINSRNCDNDDTLLFIDEIDEKIILPAVQVFHRTHSPELNLVGLLATISDHLWTLSKSARVFLKEASNFYMLKSDRIIFARVLYHLKLVDTAKNRELLHLFEQLHKSSCSLDSSVLAAHADLVSECDESSELVFDFVDEDSENESVSEIDALLSSVDFECDEEPIWEDLASLVYSKADFRTFISLRPAS